MYTAVTRGRRRVYVIAEEAHLRSAISRNNVRRKTRLKHFLQDQLSSSSASPAEGASPAKGPEDGRGASTPLPASPFPAAAADSVTDDGQASAAAFEAFACPGGWRGPFPGETNAGEDPFQPRGSKRTCAMAEESPSKVRMVGAMFSRAWICLNAARRSCWCVPGRRAFCPCGVGCRTETAFSHVCYVLSAAPLVLVVSPSARGWHARRPQRWACRRGYCVCCTFVLQILLTVPSLL